MAELNVSTGLVEYDLNGAVKVYFNPTDAAFAEKITNVFSALELKQNEYKERIAAADTTAAVFEVAHEMDAYMREAIDELFGVPVCSPLFGSMNVYALSDGAPLWMNLLFSIMEQMDTAFDGAGTDIRRRVDAYTAKYRGRK